MLSISRPQAIGHLNLLWEFATDFCKDGGVGRNYSDLELEAAVDWTGDPGKLVAGLVETGWLDEDENCRLGIHDWDQHCEESVKKYMRDKRTRFWNGSKPFTSNKVGVAKSSEKYRKVSPAVAVAFNHSQEPLTKKQIQTPLRAEALARSFERIWAIYPNKKSRGQAERAWAKLEPSPELIAEMLAAVGAQISWRERCSRSGQWTPEWKNFSTWLHAKCWLDEVNNGSTGRDQASQRSAAGTARKIGNTDADFADEIERARNRGGVVSTGE